MSRINTYPEAQSVGADDYLIIDGSTNGTKRLRPKNLYSDETKAIKSLSLQNILKNEPMEKGSLNGANGLPTNSNTRVRTGYIDVSFASYLKVDVVTEGYKYVIYFYSDVDVMVRYSVGSYWVDFANWHTTPCVIPLLPTIKYIRIALADTSDSADISVSDNDKVLMFCDNALMHQKRNQDQLTKIQNSFASSNTVKFERFIWANGTTAYTSSVPAIVYINKSPNRIWSGLIELPEIASIVELEASDGYNCILDYFDDELNRLVHYDWATSIAKDVQASAKYAIVIVRKTDDADISPNEGINISMAFGLNSNVQYVENISNNSSIDLKWSIGSLQPGQGTETVSTSRLRSRYILVGKGTRLILKNSTDYIHLFYLYDLNKRYLSDVSWSHNSLVIDQDGYIRILTRKVDASDISSDEIDTLAQNEVIERAFPQSLIEMINDEDIVKVPTYFEENLSNAIASVKNNVFDAGIDGDSFVFITDVHWQSNSRHSPKLIERIIASTNVGRIMCGGDLIGGGEKSAMIDLMADCVNSFKGIAPFYVVYGNHDGNGIGAPSSSDNFTKGNTYAIAQKSTDTIMNYGDLCYFYFDNQTTKTRYICLDTGGGAAVALSAAQSEWLSGALNTMPSGYHALIFAHIYYEQTNGWHVGLQPSELQRTGFMNSVCTILDTFNTNNIDKKVEAMFGGHVHIDCNFSSPGGIPIVLSDCDTRQTFTTDDGTTAKHAIGTVNEQCFDITTINYSTKTIKCVRVGRGVNRTITY